MKNNSVKFIVLFLSFCSSFVVFAEDRPQIAVVKTLKLIFDKPNSDLSVDAVAVSQSGKYSLASWSQNEAGGRALLKNNGGIWEVILCGGKDLLKTNTLEQVGIDKRESYEIIQKLKDSENKFTKKQRSTFDSFKSIAENIHPKVVSE